jgi:tetratricopeptide (TPR) repeat protein
VDISPGNYQTKLMLGNAYFFQRQWTESKHLYEELIELNPNVPAAYFRLGILQRAMQQSEPALNNFEKAMSLNPRLIDVFTNIIIIHIGAKDFAKAHQRCDRQMEKMADAPAVLAAIQNLKGEIYLAEGKKGDAVTWYKKALETYPGYMRPYYALARIFRAEKNEEEAIGQYEAALKVNPQQVAPHMMLGAIYDTQKKFEMAETHYRKALKINREFAPAANNLAYVLLMQEKDLDEALRYAQQAETKRPDDPHVMDTVGLVYYKKGQYNFAIGKFSASLEKIPENATVHYHLGLAYYKEGNNKRAHQELEKAINLDDQFDGVEEARFILSKLTYLN